MEARLGFISTLLASKFSFKQYILIDQPIIIFFSWDLMAAMAVIVMLSKIYSIYVPIKQINNKKIAFVDRVLDLIKIL